MSKKILAVIAAADKEEEIVKILVRKALNPTVIYARGMASVINFGSLFGFSDDKRVAVLASCNEAEAEALLKYFKNEMGFSKPSSGIAFYIGADGFIGLAEDALR